MKFGKVDNPELIDFYLPEDHSDTSRIFASSKMEKGVKPKIYVGCAKWNKNYLKGFFPRGTKDELAYYAQQFNCIELNATFYKTYPAEQFQVWKSKTPPSFKFFPKLPQQISHYRQLNNVAEVVDRFLQGAIELEDQLGTIFLQLNNRFAPNRFEKIENFVKDWPKDVRLALEVRHEDWYNDASNTNELCHLLESYNITHVLTDTAGRRDLMHMRMTTPTPFVRCTGSGAASDYKRLDDWIERIAIWTEQGMEELDFFIHQNIKNESALLATYFIEKLNKELGYDLNVPAKI